MQINKIYNEDCLATMAKMPNDFVDYSLTSPPYNVGCNGVMKGDNVGKKYNSIDDKMSDDDYLKNQIQVIDELLRVTKNHVFYNIQLLSANKRSVLKMMGYFNEKIKEVFIWNKKHGVPHIEPGIFNSAYEFIIIFSNQKPDKRKFYDCDFQGTQNNVFTIKNKHSNPFAKQHKAIMPLDIPRHFMQIFGKQNDVWFDPYMGTGTTAVAAILEKKQYIGSEIFDEYCKISENRIKPYLAQTTLF
jgi:DNA modification methylase